MRGLGFENVSKSLWKACGFSVAGKIKSKCYKFNNLVVLCVFPRKGGKTLKSDYVYDYYHTIRLKYWTNLDISAPHS